MLSVRTNVILEACDIWIAIFGLGSHCSHRNVQQLTLLGRAHFADRISSYRFQALSDRLCLMRRRARDDHEQGGTEQIDITVRTNFLQWSGNHFWSHECRGTAET